MDPITTFSGKTVALPIANIDTDQITPALFTKVTVKTGLGRILFAHWRYQGDFVPKPEFPLNRPGAQGATVLVSGDNFGCGSSREHAPWALVDYGFRAIISTSFADIFRGNALKNGLLPIVVDAAAHAEALKIAEQHETVSVDLPNQTLTLPGCGSVKFPIDAFSKKCLVEGIDQLGYIMKHEQAVSAFERATNSEES
ncbi:MAG: 3-isopropylmalate dehydratase small subunit [Planctomycetes bacterium]|nr:3-isopropylmalate dehydratase small subunit [Planctomycetota bacterium]